MKITPLSTENRIVSDKSIVGILSWTNGIRSVYSRKWATDQYEKTMPHRCNSGLKSKKIWESRVVFIVWKVSKKPQFAILFYHHLDFMAILMVTSSQTGRQLSRSLIGLLKQWVATSLQRINYVKQYTLVAGKIQRQEQKIVFITTTEDKKDKLLQLLQKQWETTMVWLETNPVGEVG